MTKATSNNYFKHCNKPTPGIEVCVILPVKNEAKYLAQTLEALRLQVDENGLPLDTLRYEVLVMINNSTDKSHQIALAYVKKYPSFNLHLSNVFLSDNEANIGTVRKLLMDEAYKRLLKVNNSRAIIASTDGDTVVDCKWISTIISEIKNGNDAVGGRILINGDKHNQLNHYRKDDNYRCLLSHAECIIDPQEHNPMPSHFQFFGANLAVTASMYQKAGRLPKVMYLEDNAFHHALNLKDARIRKSFNVTVYTSPRINGRVQIGFSEQLKKWQKEKKAKIPQLVENTKHMLLLFSTRKRLRACWSNYKQCHAINFNELSSLANIISMDISRLLSLITNSDYFGVLWQEIEPGLKLIEHKKLQSIDQATRELKLFIKRQDFNFS